MRRAKRCAHRGKGRGPAKGVVFGCLAMGGIWAVALLLGCGNSKASRAMEAYIYAPAPSGPEGGRVLLDAPFLDQREKYPTGCESVTAAMALQYAGVDVSPDEMIAAIPQGRAPGSDGAGGYIGCDPREAFPGNPYTHAGWGCYAPVVLRAAEDILRERDETSLSILDLTGTALEGLEEYLRGGTPVLVWGTIGMQEPEADITFTIEGTDEEFQWIYPMHCLLLVGVDEESYYFNDPMAGKAVAYPKGAVARAYEGLGRQALAFAAPV